MATTYSKGQNIGSLFNAPLIVEVPLTPANSKVVTQVITAKDGKPGYIFRGKALMLAAAPAATKVAGFIDADADQFLASSGDGYLEPAGLTFTDLELSYVEDGAGTRVWQKKTDINASALTTAIAESGITTVTGAARAAANPITDFIVKNIWIILGILALVIVFLMSNSNKKGKKSKGFSFGF